MTTEKELAERLVPKHLARVTEPEIAESEAALKKPKPAPVSVENDPKMQREYTFDFSWTDGRGKVWAGKFTNKILSIRERQMMGVMRARLADNTPQSAFNV